MHSLANFLLFWHPSSPSPPPAFPSSPMAIPLPKIPQPIRSSLSLRPYPIATFFPCRRSPFRPLNTAFSDSAAPKPRFRASPVAKDESLTSIITELEDEQTKQLEGNLSEQQQRKLAEQWRELHGEKDWAGLLDPMDPLLRSELIRYGEFAQACYDAFDYDPYSRYCGSCRFPRRCFFADLGLEAVGYDVTRYLYATSNINLPNFVRHSRWSKTWSQRANWIGFVAVSDDATTARIGRRDIVVAWRGTVTKLEWIADLMDFLRPAASEGIPCPDSRVKVESGFVDLYTDKDPTCRFCKYSVREQVLAEVRKLLEQYQTETVSITVTGHSLGSALAMLSAYDLVESGVARGRETAVCVFSFSGPRVGNRAFKERFEGIGVKALRVVNVHDTVPKVPGVLFNERVPAMVQRVVEGLPWSYCHVGVELVLDHKHSPFLKETGDPSCFHNLEAHLHLLDGYRGKGQRFVLASGRDPALVNKACDFLKDHHLVPPHWRQDENKGMIRSRDGRWVQADRPKLDDHPPDTHHHLSQLGLILDH